MALLVALSSASSSTLSNKRTIVNHAGASAGDEDTEDELEYGGESRATTLPRGMQSAISAATNSLPRLPAPSAPTGLTTTTSLSSSSAAAAAAATSTSSPMHKAHSVYHFLPQHSGVKSARYRPPGFARNSNIGPGAMGSGPKRAVSAPGLQVSGTQSATSKRDNSRSRRQQTMSLTSGKSQTSFFKRPSTDRIESHILITDFLMNIDYFSVHLYFWFSTLLSYYFSNFFFNLKRINM